MIFHQEEQVFWWHSFFMLVPSYLAEAPDCYIYSHAHLLRVVLIRAIYLWIRSFVWCVCFVFDRHFIYFPGHLAGPLTLLATRSTALPVTPPPLAQTAIDFVYLWYYWQYVRVYSARERLRKRVRSCSPNYCTFLGQCSSFSPWLYSLYRMHMYV